MPIRDAAYREFSDRPFDGPRPPDPLFNLNAFRPYLPGGTLGVRAQHTVERVLSIDALNRLYDKATASGSVLPGGTGHAQFIQRLLDGLGVRVCLAAEDAARIPKEGPFVVVSNHPFGALDGLILSKLLAERRDDVKVMANYLLGRVPELKDLFLLVDPFNGSNVASRNVSPIRQSLRWLKEGHVLATFPAGEVSHLSLSNLTNPEGLITDPTWNSTIARIIARADVPVLPVYFDGCNPTLFQLAGLVHPMLRTALLPRALFSKVGTQVTVRVGSLIPASRIRKFDSDDQVTDYLRRRTFLLRHGVPRPSIQNASPPADGLDGANRFEKAWTMAYVVDWMKARFGIKRNPPIAEVVSPVDPALLEADVNALPPEATLLVQGGMEVLYARAPQLRNVLREIGRLREITFRDAGEGTGKSIDLDTFDYDYTHLFIYDRPARRIVGAYRLGQSDQLLPTKGRQGLYSNTLFNYKAEVLQRLNPGLELGRSFVSLEYQKSYAPLLLLWKGIGHFLVQHPRYRYLFGPVSISNTYKTISREMMVRFLSTHHSMPEYNASLVRPRNPFRPAKRSWLGSRSPDTENSRRLLQDDDELSEMISNIEPDQKGLPVLIRQYLKLGAKFVAFNVDRDFGDCLDGLIIVDMLHTEARKLERYMTPSGYASFVSYHRSDRKDATLNERTQESSEPLLST